MTLLSPQTKRDLEKLVDEINAGRPQCPVGLNTLVIPRKVTLGEHVNQPYVYLNCGHVQGKLFGSASDFEFPEKLPQRSQSRLHLIKNPDLCFKTFRLPPSGHHDWGQDKASGGRRCPMCLDSGPVVTLCMGIEPAFYVDSGPPTYAFNPCGHMATEKTVK